MSDSVKANGLIQGQTEVRMAKFGPFLEYEHISRKINLPSGYGKDRIVAMVRDPWWIFVYWEITPRTEKEVKHKIKKNSEHFEKSILRTYDITGRGDFNGLNASGYFDITLKNMARNWYIDLGWPNRRLCVEIGLLSKEGNFYALARSNVVQTPRFGMSDVLDEAWMLSEHEYWWLFGASGGLDVGKSSLEMKELFQKRLQEWISSGGIVSFASHLLQKRK
ncbi:MAG: DUF4912 domain-containing protein [Candidatus Omnitrophica bacterium]|nr:DUF4912 domain-containing protein [Candidatus Omnitrophota bacterium]